jgi:hypothetical protein
MSHHSQAVMVEWTGLGAGRWERGGGWSRGCGIRFSSLKSHVQFTDVSHLGKRKSVKKNIHRH